MYKITVARLDTDEGGINKAWTEIYGQTVDNTDLSALQETINKHNKPKRIRKKKEGAQ